MFTDCGGRTPAILTTRRRLNIPLHHNIIKKTENFHLTSFFCSERSLIIYIVFIFRQLTYIRITADI